MDTQNTPIHIKLWHRDFWRLCFANLLLMTSVCMLIIGIPYFMTIEGYRYWQIGVVVGAYGFGLFLLGGFCSYLLQRYRRNRVCLVSICCVAISLVALYYLETFWNIKFGFGVLVATRVVQGAFLGLAQMALTSTLVIDTCESFQRTEANYITSWFARLSIATGPIIVWLVDDFSDMHLIFPVASLLALGAFVLVSLVKFPFKAPSEHLPLFSYDRFFLPQGIPLFINIVLILIGAGMYFAIPHNLTVYLMFLLGLLMAIVAEKYVFADADLKSQALEPACWIAIRRANRVILAGDHCQLPPTVKSIAALKAGLGKTLMERIVHTQLTNGFAYSPKLRIIRVSLETALISEAKHLIVDTSRIANTQHVYSTVYQLFTYPVDSHIALRTYQYLTFASQCLVVIP